MKCHKPNTDQALELTVIASGKPCDEYMLPSSSNTDPNVLECFIPVSEGNELTLSGAFTGSVLHASFDVLADGSFLGGKRIEGPKTGELKYYKKRKLDIKNVFDSVAKPASFGDRNIVEGYLQVKAVRNGFEGSPMNVDAKALGVGSLTLISSLNQETTENYEQKYPSIVCGHWASRSQEDVTDGGIVPTYELEVKVMDDDVNKTKQSKHIRHIKQTRFGPKPWAKFIFHYRTQAAIDEAGCEERDAESQALEPGDEDTFVRASTETPKKGATRNKRKEADVEDDEIMVASIRSVKAVVEESLFVTPPPTSGSPPACEQWQVYTTPTPEAPKKYGADAELGQESPLEAKRQKMGGQFSRTADTAAAHLQRQQDVMTASQDNVHDSIEPALQAFGQDYEGNGDGLEHIMPFSAYNQILDRQEAMNSTSPTGETSSLLSDGEITEFIQDFLHDASQTAAPVVQMVAPVAEMASHAGEQTKEANVEQTHGLGQVRSVHIKQEDATAPSSPDAQHAEDIATAKTTIPLHLSTSKPRTNAFTSSPSPSLAHSTTNMTSPPPPLSHAAAPSPRLSQTYPEDASFIPCNLTPDQIALFIPPQGIKISQLKEHFTEEQLPTNRGARVQFLQMLKAVARNTDEVYYLKCSSPVRTRSQRTVTPKIEVLADNTSAKEEPETDHNDHTPTKPTSVLRGNPTPPPSTTSLKRGASAMTASADSRSSTPASISNKKARTSALASKKAELLAQLEVKKRKKTEALKALQEQQDLRMKEEQLLEQAEMREIEMLQSKTKMEDDELETLEQQRMEEVEGWEEARQAREKVEEIVRAGSEEM